VSIEPSQTKELNVTVKVDQDAEDGSSDLGFLSIKQATGETV
jgi:hypothetical protein